MSRNTILALLLVVAAIAGASGVLGRLSGGHGDTVAAGRTGKTVVTRVIDGDTAVLASLGRSRFIGIDTPEVYGQRQCFGPQASAFTKRVLSGQRVRYAIGAEPRDRYGRALVYLWLADGRFFNELLAEQGYARTLAIAPNVRYAALFADRASQARAAGRGLWSSSACP